MGILEVMYSAGVILAGVSIVSGVSGVLHLRTTGKESVTYLNIMTGTSIAAIVLIIAAYELEPEMEKPHSSEMTRYDMQSTGSVGAYKRNKMKKIYTYKPQDLWELTMSLRDSSNNADREFAFRNSDLLQWEHADLKSISVLDERPFIDIYNRHWTQCAVATWRYPNEAPEGVTPLPEGENLVYLGDDVTLGQFHKAGGDDLWQLIDKRWMRVEGGGKYQGPFAVEANSQFAREYFPELVRAMGESTNQKIEEGRWYLTKQGLIGRATKLIESETNVVYMSIAGKTFDAHGWWASSSPASVDIGDYVLREVRATELDGTEIR